MKQYGQVQLRRAMIKIIINMELGRSLQIFALGSLLAFVTLALATPYPSDGAALEQLPQYVGTVDKQPEKETIATPEQLAYAVVLDLVSKTTNENKDEKGEAQSSQAKVETGEALAMLEILQDVDEWMNGRSLREISIGLIGDQKTKVTNQISASSKSESQNEGSPEKQVEHRSIDADGTKASKVVGTAQQKDDINEKSDDRHQRSNAATATEHSDTVFNMVFEDGAIPLNGFGATAAKSLSKPKKSKKKGLKGYAIIGMDAPPRGPVTMMESDSAGFVESAESDEGGSQEPAVKDYPDDTLRSKNIKGKMPVITRVLSVDGDQDAFSCSEHRGPLRPLSNGSKYFIDALGDYTYANAKDLCDVNNLVIAEIENMGDHRSLQTYFSVNYKGKNLQGIPDMYYIGMNDVRTEGSYMRGDRKNILFQNYHPSQPDDNNQAEDCSALIKESNFGPIGTADVDCNMTGHVLCMSVVNSQCYNESKETIDNRKIEAMPPLKLLVNATQRAYFASSFQATWKEAMNYCKDKRMQLFDMDEIVTKGFFNALLKYEAEFVQVPVPTIQYWTAGKFKGNHMTAPIIWHKKAELTESEERGVQKHNGTFTWSGQYHWSSKKKTDPGGPYGYRRDLCVSFGFESFPDPTPYIRNTNCDLPGYFVCYAVYNMDESATLGT